MQASRTRPPTNLFAMARSLVTHRDLVWQMARREVAGRYKGSALGLLWSFFYPLLMLAAYTFAFSYVFKVSPRGTATTQADIVDFALYVFSGLVLFTLFTEVVTRAPTFILGNANYVKKVVFPLEVFPYVYMGASLIHAAISLLVLLLATLVLHLAVGLTHPLAWTVVLAPLPVIPLVLVVLGAAWLLSALGVYLRDVAQTIGIVATMLMYLSPVFYTVEKIDSPALRTVIRLNPLTIPLETFRWTLGQTQALPEWPWLVGYAIGSVLVAWAGFFFFQRTKRGFADVL
jgi:lipopolysaccharide transport system permease protein